MKAVKYGSRSASPLNSASVGKKFVIEYSDLLCTNKMVKSHSIVPGTFFMAYYTSSVDCDLPLVMEKYKKLTFEITAVSAPTTERRDNPEKCRNIVCEYKVIEFQTVFARIGNKTSPFRYILKVSYEKLPMYGLNFPTLYPNEWFN